MAVTNQSLYDITGIRLPADACVVIINTEWNSTVVNALTEGCIQSLTAAGVAHQLITVPGAFEIPFAIKSYWDTHKYKDNRPHAFVALGCVLRGDTPHFDYVCKAVTDGVVQLNLQLPVPVIFGVLTVDDQQQADERIGGKHGHKGQEAGVTAVKMIHLKNSFTR